MLVETVVSTIVLKAVSVITLDETSLLTRVSIMPTPPITNESSSVCATGTGWTLCEICSEDDVVRTSSRLLDLRLLSAVRAVGPRLVFSVALATFVAEG